MDAFKEFQGKTLDEAIEEACRYYGVEREKLEIEIVSDAKGGIFGLVGSKKASIRAARVQLPGVSPLLEADSAAGDAPTEGRARSERAEKGREKKPRETGRKADASPKGRGKEKPDVSPLEAGPEQPADPGSSTGRSYGKGRRSPEKAQLPLDELGDVNGNILPAGQEMTEERMERPDKSRSRGTPTRPSHERQGGSEAGASVASQPGNGTAPGQGSPRLRDDIAERIAARKAARQGSPAAASPPSASSAGFDETAREELPAYDLEACDQDALFSLVRETVSQLVIPIVGEMSCSLSLAGSRIRITIDCGESSGLLVGREGQTLAAVQYIASRIIAKRLGGSVRLQFDAGNYRERQDERLRELALSLAERVKKNHCSLSTRPLSAYQRRVIHLTLECDKLVHTFSKGEGLQRRVIIQLRRGGASELAEEAEDQDVMYPDSFELEDSEADSGENL